MAPNINENSYEESTESSEKSIWVFGYASLIWKPDFEFHSQRIGYIEGYARRFWQGSRTHRGTNNKPGRVATLVQQDQGKVWGLAFELRGQEQIQNGYQYLGVRECALGGYDTQVVPFISRDHGNEVLQTVLFWAVPGNKDYLGEASVEQLSEQITSTRGSTGHNVEYITRLADYMRMYVPEEQDEHLFELDNSIRNQLRTRNIPLESLLTKIKPIIPVLTNKEMSKTSPQVCSWKSKNCNDSTQLVLSSTPCQNEVTYMNEICLITSFEFFPLIPNDICHISPYTFQEKCSLVSHHWIPPREPICQTV